MTCQRRDTATLDALFEQQGARTGAGGMDPQRAARLASLIASACEGGLIQARVAGSDRPLQDTTTMVLDTLEGLLLKRRS